ncbi:MAG: hypothetical protein OHK0015_07860 [Chloroflexi bacterium OHK40]
MTAITLRVTLWVGLLLTLVGVLNRYVIGVRGGGAFLPLLLGMLIAILGTLAMEPQYARRALLAVALLALLGMLGTLSVLPELRSLNAGRQPAQVAAIIARALMLLLCALLLATLLVAGVSLLLRRVRRSGFRADRP